MLLKQPISIYGIPPATKLPFQSKRQYDCVMTVKVVYDTVPSSSHPNLNHGRRKLLRGGVAARVRAVTLPKAAT